MKIKLVALCLLIAVPALAGSREDSRKDPVHLRYRRILNQDTSRCRIGSGGDIPSQLFDRWVAASREPSKKKSNRPWFGKRN